EGIGEDAVRCCGDGGTLAWGSGDRTVRLWDLAKRKTRRTLKGHSDFVTALRFLGPSTLLTCSHDRTVRLWEVRTGKKQRLFRTGESMISVAVAPDGKSFVALGGLWGRRGLKSACRRWQTAGLKKLSPLGEHDEPIGGVEFSPDGRLLITGSADRTVRVWDLATGARLADLQHTAWVQGLAV